MQRFIVAASLVVALALGLFAVAPLPASAQDLYNCADIATRGDALAILNADPTDPNRIDRDNDGVPCEKGVGGGSVTFDSVSGAGATTMPSTGVGSTASTSAGLTTILLALFAVASIATGGISLIRGRRA